MSTLEKKEPVAEVKTTVYTTEQQAGGTNYGADLADRTEGNQNWAETGGEKYTAQELKDMANETARVAQPTAAESTMSGLEQAKDTAASKASGASAVMHEKYEQGKERLGHDVEVGKEKLGETYNAAGERLHEAKDYTVETGHSMAERLREAQDAVTHKTQEWAESAQHTLEQAREKAREVFTGAGQKVEEQSNKMSTSTYAPGEATEIKVKAEEAPSGGIDRLKVEARSTESAQ